MQDGHHREPVYSIMVNRIGWRSNVYTHSKVLRQRLAGNERQISSDVMIRLKRSGILIMASISHSILLSSPKVPPNTLEKPLHPSLSSGLLCGGPDRRGLIPG